MQNLTLGPNGDLIPGPQKPPGNPDGSFNPETGDIPQCREKCVKYWDDAIKDVNEKIDMIVDLAATAVGAAGIGSGGVGAPLAAYLGSRAVRDAERLRSLFNEKAKEEKSKCDKLCPCE